LGIFPTGYHSDEKADAAAFQDERIKPRFNTFVGGEGFAEAQGQTVRLIFPLWQSGAHSNLLMFRLSDFLASVRRETDLEQQKKPLRLGGAEVGAMEATA
jgi:hypothetical protein